MMAWVLSDAVNLDSDWLKLAVGLVVGLLVWLVRMAFIIGGIRRMVYDSIRLLRRRNRQLSHRVRKQRASLDRLNSWADSCEERSVNLQAGLEGVETRLERLCSENQHLTSRVLDLEGKKTRDHR